ncbi:hypothetical protein [Achromobacter aloeverae]|uniref:G domain-containing protein n=1 Tax=Achromobacter aloeverae TaxID=1750518 RepID=A0A4Q1HH48_9BURK|nr:hypothetical protein [Achromobacter aloeverae]RXN86727.1 hypothetical protein C7R54_17530 [Achromobacter aloeverae]
MNNEHVFSDAADKLISAHLPALLTATTKLARARRDVSRVDGQIIGTGVADFTKGNTSYMLNYQGKTFQLLDVPGIEGDESKYEGMVREAVAKAHLVVYVNGTNKKPEKATAEKIRSYLRWGTQVLPIVNVRGNADAYEFEEDRDALEKHGGARNALRQTVGVLEAVLPEDTLLPGKCVQGLLAFSSLAIDGASKATTIHPSRDKDLVIQQRNYRKFFATPEEMFNFSQIGEIRRVLAAKLPNFQEAIIESNKVKVSQLLTENLAELNAKHAEYQAFLEKVDKSVDASKALFTQALKTFERSLEDDWCNTWTSFFNTLSEKAADIVADDFGDNDVIEAKIKRTFKAMQPGVGEELQQQLTGLSEDLQSRTHEAMRRFVVDVQRLQFEQSLRSESANSKVSFSVDQLDMDLSLKEWGSIAFNIGSYATTGGMIGSAFPVLGTAIGAAIGAVVGLLVSTWGIFTSKDKRIRKAQQKVISSIDDMRIEHMPTVREEIKKIVAKVRKDIIAPARAWADAERKSLHRPLAVIEQQTDLMSNIKQQLEEMPYGTIQAIQR